MTAECRLADATFDPAEELANFSAQAAGCGAISSFSGIARPVGKQGSDVSAMFLESHPRLTAASMNGIAADARQKFGIAHLIIIHRHGTIMPGEAIVFVAAASSHRRAALESVDYMMDRLKTEAVFWKREDTAEGSQWIEPTGDDYAANSRWDKTETQ